MSRMLAGALLSAPLWYLLLPAAGAPAPCANAQLQEPLVVHDISGSTLIGPIHRHLAVYNNGLVSLSESGSNTTGVTGGKADFTYIPADDAKKLYADLVSFGALTECDETLQANDVPLTTVSVFRGETNARVHTYSHMVANSPTAQLVETRISQFIAATFPNF